MHLYPKLSHSRILKLVLVLTAVLLPRAVIGDAGAANDDASNQKRFRKIQKACHVSGVEGDPQKLKAQNDCLQRAELELRRRADVERELQTTLGNTSPPIRYGQPLGARPPTGSPPSGAGPLPVPGATNEAGGSVSNTPSTCGPGAASTDNALIRVHRILMAPKDASDDFGHRLGRRFLIYQVTISNDNKDYQYLIHDVGVDLSPFFCVPDSTTLAGTNCESGDYRYSASSQDLTLLRGIPEKGQDLDRRNLILHVLQGIGSVAGAVTGLTPFAGVMGPAASVFNGSLLQGYVGVAPDHTSTQLNRLSDSAYIANTLVDKQRAKTIAIFIPEATLLSPDQQEQYWKNPSEFLQTIHLNQADVCVDGAFIATVVSPTLTGAVLIPKASGSSLAAGVQATLIVQGANLTTSDTQVVGLGPALLLSSSHGTAGAVDVTLPADYAPGVQVHLASAANPSLTSSPTATTTVPPLTLTTAVLAQQSGGPPLGPGASATLTITGTNLIKGDTQVVGLGPTPLTLTNVNDQKTTATVTITLPPNYTPGVQVHLASASITLFVPSFTSSSVATTTS